MEASETTTPEDRLNAIIERLEQAADRLAAHTVAASSSTRESELERLLAEAESTITTLRSARKTAAAIPTLIAKEGASAEPAALDAALSSLSLEQRITVKSQLLRTGLLG